MHLGIKTTPINVMHKNTIKYFIKLDLCKDSGLDEPVLALLRIGVSEVSFWKLLFNLVCNLVLFSWQLLLLVLRFRFFNFNHRKNPNNVLYMKECRYKHEQMHRQLVI